MSASAAWRVLPRFTTLGAALAVAVVTAAPAAGTAGAGHHVGGRQPHVGPITEISRGSAVRGPDSQIFTAAVTP